jgi:hypothetical protein
MKINEDFAMRSHRIVEHLVGQIEEEFEGYRIYIENNPDHYCGGYEWSVCKDNEILDSDFAFSIEAALDASRTSIMALNTK